MLVVEQNAAMALELADHAYLLETGRLVMSGPAKEIANDENVRKAYLGMNECRAAPIRRLLMGGTHRRRRMDFLSSTQVLAGLSHRAASMPAWRSPS